MVEHPTSSHPFHQEKRGRIRDKRPKSPCPVCLLPGVTASTGDLLDWTCTRGHEWAGTLKQAERHAEFIHRLFIGPPT